MDTIFNIMALLAGLYVLWRFVLFICQRPEGK